MFSIKPLMDWALDFGGGFYFHLTKTVPKGERGMLHFPHFWLALPLGQTSFSRLPCMNASNNAPKIPGVFFVVSGI